MKIVIVDYGLGNLRSVSGAVKHLGYDPLITNKREDIETSAKLILPGVGAFGDGMKNLREAGLDDSLACAVIRNKTPILGICLGAQLMARESCEFGCHQGLGWIDASVVRIEAEGVRVPHVGWNNLLQLKDNLLFQGIERDALFYYVHSYHIRCAAGSQIEIGACEHGIRFCAALNDGNIYAVQFHPEKSQLWGLRLLKNFLEKA